MNQKRIRWTSIIVMLVFAVVSVAGCATKETVQEQTGTVDAQPETTKKQTVVLYTNDIHASINNWEKDENDNDVRGLSFASLAAYKQELADQGDTVYVVDAGDSMHGMLYGILDQGYSVMDLMNAVGYDAAVPGDHDLEYGMYPFFERTAQAAFPYVACNFYEENTEHQILPSYQVIEKNGTKIAFVGIMAPGKWTDSDKTYVSHGQKRAKDFYKEIQRAVNQAKKQADYVIAIGHTGVTDDTQPACSTNIIAHISGLDAYIDGHSHTSMDMQLVEDADGNQIPLTQTGGEFCEFGKMTITEDGIKTELITEYEACDEQVEKKQTAWIETVEKQMEDTIATSDTDLASFDEKDERLARRMETNLTDLSADSIYYYINERKQMGCDAAFIPAGGVRDEIASGEISYTDCKRVNPFGNYICMVQATGQEILDALEWTSAQLGETDADGQPTECGFLMHTAGLQYEIDTQVPSTCVEDARGMWQSGPTGAYRVKNVKIYDRKRGDYEPIDLKKEYAVASYHYLLRNNGGGLTMFEQAPLLLDYIGLDYVILADYLMQFEKTADMPVIATQNSPLRTYQNYLMDYENLYGSGRMILTQSVISP